MFSLLDCKKLPSITFVVFIISGWKIIQSQSYRAADNFDGFHQFSTHQHYAPFREIPKDNRHFSHPPRLGQHHNFPPQQNLNQNFGTASRLNISKWINGPLVFATTTAAPARPQLVLDNKQQNFPPNYNFNQNSVTGNHLNRNKWVQGPLVFATTTAAPSTTNSQVILGKDLQTLVQFIPFATTPTAEFLDCFAHCPTTSEYNPVCANNRQQYHNEQKFICAKRCGQDIHIVRRGSCVGLFPVSIG